MSEHQEFLREAIELAVEGVRARSGGPFGAVVVKDGKVIGRGRNQVTSLHDPTAHAEVQAIREACAALGSFQLDGCVLYASCEPCPMCLSAIYWARLERVVYAADRGDAARAGFDDELLYREIALPIEERSLPMEKVDEPTAADPFRSWADLEGRVDY